MDINRSRFEEMTRRDVSRNRRERAGERMKEREGLEKEGRAIVGRGEEGFS